MEQNLTLAFGLTLFAGLATGVGSALAFFAKKTNTRFLCVSLGFSAGVMIYVSMIEIFFKAKTALTGSLGEKAGSWWTVIAFFGGMLLIALIDKLVPSFENPHELHEASEMDDDHCARRNGAREDDAMAANDKQAAAAPAAGGVNDKKLLRMGVMSALAIAIHNFPEGLATFTAALHDPRAGVAITVAIAIHNIPEGIAVSIPIYYATGSRLKAFWYSFLSGASEPVGALLGYFLLMRYFNETMFGILFAAVAGIMVFISFDELLPTSEKYGEHHLTIYGVISGMVVMALSLLMFI